MRDGGLGTFKKISLQRKMISIFKKKKSNFYSVIESLKKTRASLVSEQFRFSNTLEDTTL